MPPIEGAFEEHLKRSALAVAIDKQSNIAKPVLPCLDNYGWTVKDANLVPVLIKKPLWPQEMTKSVLCGCTKGCTRNCSCAKKDVQCYVRCRCTGSPEKCSCAMCMAQVETESSSSSSSDTESDEDW